MKLITTVLLFLFSVLALSAQNKVFTSKEKGFTVTYPETWSLLSKELMPILDFSALAPKKDTYDKFSENVNVVVDSSALAKKGLETYINTSLKSLGPYLQKYEFVSIGIDSTNKDMAATTFVYTHFASEMNLKVLTYVYLINNKAYIVTCSAEKDQFDEYKPTFINICRSFKLN